MSDSFLRGGGRLLSLIALVGLSNALTSPAAAARVSAELSGLPATSEVAEPVLFVCPMHPQIRQDQPGNCPICGMALVQREPALASTRTAAGSAAEQSQTADEHAGEDRHVHAAGLALPPPQSTSALPGTQPPAGSEAAANGLYVCPMHPQIQQDEPGRCPICGMALVQRERDSAKDNDDNPGLQVSAAALQRLGVRIGTVERHALKPRQRAPGRVLALPSAQRSVQARVEGWVERLAVRAVGERVRAGQVLAEIYAPEIERIRPEFELGEAAAAGASERLRRLGLAAADIQRLREGGRARIPLRAPLSGAVRAVSVREGARVSADSVLFDIDGLDGRWIEARLPLAQALALGEVTSARLRLPGSAQVIELEGPWERLPQLDPVTQTQALRLAVDAESVPLPLEAYVELELIGEPQPPQLLIPRSAVIRSLSGARVVQRTANGELRPRVVELGAFAGDQVEVLAGLDRGDEIVISGQFLLDAEADLSGALQRLLGDRAAPSSSGHDHAH